MDCKIDRREVEELKKVNVLKTFDHFCGLGRELRDLKLEFEGPEGERKRSLKERVSIVIEFAKMSWRIAISFLRHSI